MYVESRVISLSLCAPFDFRRTRTRTHRNTASSFAGEREKDEQEKSDGFHSRN